MYFYGIDIYYILLVIPAVIFAGWAQMKVKSTFKAYSRSATRSGLTGAAIARRILDANGLQEVQVEHVSGNLTDHYDPSSKVIRLSDSVYASASISAIGVAAHETGHALQHATAYTPLTIRNMIIPVTNIGSKLSMPMLILGFILGNGFEWMVVAGLVLFALVALFQLITLPVEFNASRRAIATLNSFGIVDSVEESGVRKVLTAAALTYVAALIVSLAQLLRLVLIFGKRSRD